MILWIDSRHPAGFLISTKSNLQADKEVALTPAHWYLLCYSHPQKVQQVKRAWQA